MASRLGMTTILQCLIDSSCDLNSKTKIGETTLMVCVKYKHEDCLKVLAREGADFGLVNISGQLASSIAGSCGSQSGDVVDLKALIGQGDIDLDKQDERYFSVVMVTAKEGHVDAF
ncbi:unnamed protein product [Fraxinus pennsylvanica]|uniref:Uncharacterized protein n=1 Tax=Fraxinus pennsylvanica TaxID=56036 RepID=A0AAD1Z3Y8_9LAMI|nr:unnamed protein product [Fraxinus pennsylvanica]